MKVFIQRSLSARSWDWQSVALAVALVQIASTRLVISQWSSNLSIVQPISLYAVTLGLLLGYSHFTGRNSAWIAFEYALLIIPISLLTVVDKAERTNFYSDDMQNLLFRLFDSIVLFLKNQPVHDTLFFILLASMGFWLIGCYLGYRLIRYGSFLEAVIGPGLVILIIQVYDSLVPLRAWMLAFFIFLSLALLGRMHYLENKKGWKKKQVFLSPDTEGEFSRSVLFSAALAVFIAWALPGAISSIKPISKAWHDLTHPVTDRLSNAVTALESPYTASTGGDFYESELMLGSKAPTSDTAVLFVDIPKTAPYIPRYYWRGRTYDTYQNGQWLNSNSQRKNYNPDLDEIDPEEPQGTRTRVDLKVTVNFPNQDLLYAPSEVRWFNRDGKLLVAPMDNGSEEVLGMVADPGLTAGDSYRVQSMIAAPTTQELRGAGVEYPAWVTERYMQVPDKLEPQLKALTEEITAPYTNPFDKTQAITSYLRRTIEYQTSITETPPPGEDLLLWVLFDYQKGFCMYYASAEVLMLRTVGIPARMAVGFVEGTFDEERNRYTVTPLDAHAWPEVYFPNIGWIEFEPTGNQLPLDRPQTSQDDNLQADTTTPNSEPLTGIGAGPDNSAGIDSTQNEPNQLPTSQSTNQSMRFIVFALSITLIALAITLSKRYAIAERLPVYLAQRYSRNGNPPPNWLAYWVYWVQLLPIEKNYQSINLSLRWLGSKQPVHNTPGERAAALIKVLPSASSDIQSLSAEYQNAVFASRPANLKLARRASIRILLKAWQARTFHYNEIIKRRYN